MPVSGVNLGKEGIRVLGVAESFRGESSVLAGLVMRADLRVDGAAFTTVTVGGDDATRGVLDIWDALDRSDIHAVLLSGCVISWFNVVDLERVRAETGGPVVCVTYEDSTGLRGDIERHFSGEAAERKLAAYERLGDRARLPLATGYDVYVRALGLDDGEAQRLLDRFTEEGRRPEPLRVARIAAHGALGLIEDG